MANRDTDPPASAAPGPRSLQATAATIDHYERRAPQFWEGTRDHDVRQNYAALLGAIEGEAPFTILDLGCGPGRDLHYFKSLGHEAVGLDGAAAFVAMARDYTGCEVVHRNFLAMDLAPGRFDGVFANASLFHVPTADLPQVLRQLAAALKPRGVLFCSNPRGDNSEGFNGDRFANYRDLDGWRRLISAAGFVELQHYYRPPGLPRDQQPWLAMVWRKT